MTVTANRWLFSIAKNGTLRRWRSYHVGAEVVCQYGACGGASTETRYTAKPTNVGRANERNPHFQAKFEMEAAYAHKLARKYSETPEGAEKPLDHMPMLAKPFDKNGVVTGAGKKFKFPAYIQPKLDGFRCLARWENEEVVLTSRQGKVFHIPHIALAVARLLPKGVVFDGELYIHGTTLQRIASLAKKNRPESEELTYVVYDCILPDLDAAYGTRHLFLAQRFAEDDAQDAKGIMHCETLTADDLEQAHELQSKWRDAGFEGAILRSVSGKYRYAYRSNDLLKLKTFQDAEFTVVGIKEGKGALGIFSCYIHGKEGEKPTDDNTFEVTLGSHAERSEQFLMPHKFIGRMLTVRYAFITEKGKPFHPTGVALREDWD